MEKEKLEIKMKGLERDMNILKSEEKNLLKKFSSFGQPSDIEHMRK